MLKNNILQWLCFVALFNRGTLTHARNKYSVTWQHYLVRNSRICVSTLINMDTISIFRITYSLVDVHRTIHMDSYVGVQNDVSLAVRKILEVKKAFKIQSNCHEALSKKNKSLQERIYQLEKMNKDMKNKLARLEVDNKKQEQIVSDLIGEVNGADFFSHALVIDNSHDVSVSGVTSECVNSDIPAVHVKSEHRENPLCPSSPATPKKQRCKRKVTPEKKTPPRKSRRLLNR